MFGTSHEQLLGAIGDLSKVLKQMTPPVLGAQSIALDANGNGSVSYRLPFGSVFIDSNSAHLLTVAASPPMGQAPGPGPGVAFVRPGGHATLNFSAYTVSVYGGAAGELVTVQAFARPQNGTASAAPPGVGIATIPGHGNATAPAAGAPIASVAGLAAGLYSVAWTVDFAGTPGAGEINNMQLELNGAVENIAMCGSVTGVPWSQIPELVQVPAGGTVSVNAIAAGTAGAIYYATLVLTLLR